MVGGRGSGGGSRHDESEFSRPTSSDTGDSSTGSQNQAAVPSGPPDEEIPF